MSKATLHKLEVAYPKWKAASSSYEYEAQKELFYNTKIQKELYAAQMNYLAEHTISYAASEQSEFDTWGSDSIYNMLQAKLAAGIPSPEPSTYKAKVDEEPDIPEQASLNIDEEDI